MITHTSDSHQMISQVKTRQSQSYKFKKIAKNSNFVKKTLHAIHLLKLLDKMYKYEKDPTRTVVARERTQDDGRMDRVKPIYPQQLCCVWGIIN